MDGSESDLEETWEAAEAEELELGGKSGSGGGGGANERTRDVFVAEKTYASAAEALQAATALGFDFESLQRELGLDLYGRIRVLTLARRAARSRFCQWGDATLSLRDTSLRLQIAPGTCRARATQSTS